VFEKLSAYIVGDRFHAASCGCVHRHRRHRIRVRTNGCASRVVANHWYQTHYSLWTCVSICAIIVVCILYAILVSVCASPLPHSTCRTMWAAGVLTALSQLTYPSVSAFVSIHSAGDRQGTVQGMVTGIRGLCTGLGPALFGAIFYMFNVDLNDAQHSVHGGLGAPQFPPPQARQRAMPLNGSMPLVGGEAPLQHIQMVWCTARIHARTFSVSCRAHHSCLAQRLCCSPSFAIVCCQLVPSCSPAVAHRDHCQCPVLRCSQREPTKSRFHSVGVLVFQHMLNVIYRSGSSRQRVVEKRGRHDHRR
jgi:hypothetical protein